jgi:hypothetical protein
MQVWQLIQKLSEMPAGADVIIAIETLEGPEQVPMYVIEDAVAVCLNGTAAQISVTAETLMHKP